MRKNYHTVKEVRPGSIAEEMGIEPGDKLVSVNGAAVEDVFDYQFMIEEEELDVIIEKPSGEEWELEIGKDEDEDLGIVFDQSLMDDYRSCRNQCIFCFIDQMPGGMRDTLYFKDDDSRLSFLQGNYVTLTNMSDHDIDRIIKYHLEPINISFHTTNPQLRCRMLNNRFAGDALDKVRRLKDAGILMNGQIVLCKGINDGAELERSMRDLTDLRPELESVSVVPVGLTKFRDGLYPLEPFTREDARGVLTTIHKWQDLAYQKYGTHFVQAGDEWYILAGEDFPPEERYDGYLQLENGVGMMRLLIDEFRADLAQRPGDDESHTVTMVTGRIAYECLRQLVGEFQLKYPNRKVNIIPVRNDFFGERITVSGLITGQDILAQLKGRELGERVLFPINMFRSGEEVFLDDYTLAEVGSALQAKTAIVPSGGRDLITSLIGEKDE